MDENFQEDHELQASNTEVILEGSIKDEDPLGHQELDRIVQDQQNQNPGSFKEDQDQKQQSCECNLDQVEVQEEVDAKKQKECDPAPSQDQLEGTSEQNPVADPSPVSLHQLLSDEDPHRALPPDQHQAEHQDQDQDQDQDLMSAAANQGEVAESGGSVPALVITQAEEQPSLATLVGPPASPAEPPEPQRPADLVSTDPSPGSSTDGGEMTCSDLLSLRSDSLSLSSEPTASRRSEDDDTRSVTASSFMSLFHRVQLDPLEKDWMRSSALGNMAAQRQLLTQEPSLVSKKDFITTALHWAAKQGRQEAVDLMIHCGADVNVRSGYTALHLASIHGHQHVVHALINTHNARTNIRDYHGKKAAHYWTGSTDVFHKPNFRSGGSFSHGRRTQRYVLPSVLLSRSRSHGQLNLEFGTVPQSTSHDVLDLQL